MSKNLLYHIKLFVACGVLWGMVFSAFGQDNPASQQVDSLETVELPRIDSLAQDSLFSDSTQND